MTYADGAPRARIAVLSRSWTQPAGERGAVIRSLAGALSRCSSVDVLVAGRAGDRGVDGVFERIGIGIAAEGRCWPEPTVATIPRTGRYGAVISDEGDTSALALARARLPGTRILLAGRPCTPGGAPATTLDVGYHDGPPRTGGVTLDAGDMLPVGLYVRVHPYAAERTHHELQGATGYVLVLSGRDGAHATAAVPSGQVRWLLARFARQRVVVVEDAVATVWRARGPVGRFGVHTRMDLWRLLAHAGMTVDLCPGDVLARECVESLRYGVPVVVPSGTPADALVEAGGGIAFSTTTTLLDAVATLCQPHARERAGARGRSAVDRWYGDPSDFVARVAAALGPLEPAGSIGPSPGPI